MTVNSVGFLAIVLPFLTILGFALLVLARALNAERKRSDDLFQQLMAKERFQSMQEAQIRMMNEGSTAPPEATPRWNPRASTVSDLEGTDMPGDFHVGD